MAAKPLVWCYEFERDVPYIGITEEAEGMLREYFDLITPSQLKDAPGRVEDIRGVVVFANIIDLMQFDKLSKLKVVANWGAGVNHLAHMFPTFKQHDIKLCYTPHAVTKGTADMAMALLLASARNIVQGHHEATGPGHEGKLRINIHGEEVSGATVGIVGMGKIGTEVAKRARGFDMTVLYHNRSRRPKEEEEQVAATYWGSLDEMLPLCDFVVLTCPLTDSTRHMMGGRQFSVMKQSATVVNVARGAVIDQDALVEALRHGKIRAAALDVTDPEPLPASHPLLELDNVVIQPHRGTATNKTHTKMWQAVIDGLKAVIIDNTDIPEHVRYDI